MVIVAQLAFTYWPVMQQLFRTEPVAFFDGALILVVGATAMAVFEMEKHLARRFGFSNG